MPPGWARKAQPSPSGSLPSFLDVAGQVAFPGTVQHLPCQPPHTEGSAPPGSISPESVIPPDRAGLPQFTTQERLAWDLHLQQRLGRLVPGERGAVGKCGMESIPEAAAKEAWTLPDNTSTGDGCGKGQAR